MTLPKWFDAHTHLRQEGLLAPIIRSQLDMGCYAVLAMPNTRPVTGSIKKDDDPVTWSLEEYRDMIMAAGGDGFDHLITPLYLHKDVTPDMIARGAESGLLRAAKCYPPHGTTNASMGFPLEGLIENGVVAAMVEHGVTLCIHGEDHGLKATEYFDRNTNAEDIFYREKMPRLMDAHPNVNVVCEHITTKTAVDFVHQAPDNVGATVTPQHLLYTIGDLIIGLKYHLYCLPVVKFAEDRQALRDAVTAPSQTKFFAGTDSAAHTKKATDCGCAAGCFTGGIAPQLYTQAFEENGLDFTRVDHENILKNFLCFNGPDFYKMPCSEETFTLSKTPQEVTKLPSEEGDITPLPVGLGNNMIPWTLTLAA